MAGLSFREWTDTLGHVLHGYGLFPTRLARARLLELEAVADLLFHSERQLNRARIQHLCEALTLAQLHSLCRQNVLEVQQLLQKAALSGQARPAWGMDRVHAAVADWEWHALPLMDGPLRLADLCCLQTRLERLATAIHVFARVEGADEATA